jgi:pyruvate ferredoxin oxidoreductase alpha subunit
MTCANRAISAPLSIWNDQQDSMSVRDAGWIQLYCADNQEAVDTTVQAYRIAERTELPVMVCMDGFTLTHTLEAIDIPSQAQVDSFLPAYSFSRTLDPHKPISLGTLVSPDFYPEARHSHHRALLNASHEIIAADEEWAAICGRHSGGLLSVEGQEDAKVAILAVGSVVGTLRDALVEIPPDQPVKLIKLRAFRPFPAEKLRQVCAGLSDIIVLERAFSPGGGGIVGTEVLAALADLPDRPRLHNFAAGLGGRDIPLAILPTLLAATRLPNPEPFSIIDVSLEKLPVEDR